MAHAATLSLSGHRRGLRAVLPFLGPAFVAAVGTMALLSLLPAW